LLWNVERLANRPEILDGAQPDTTLLRRSLDDLRRVNRWLGGASLSCAAVEHFARHRASLRLIDVGTGLGDIPIALLQWTAGHGIRLEIEAIDARPETIEAARNASAAVPGLHLRVADGRSLPYSDGSFDVAHTSLMAHHLEPDELGSCLKELRRVSRLGVIVNDLDRNPIALAGAWLLSALFATSPITRHDAPLSVRRAYRPNELARIAAGAGLVEAARFHSVLGYRYALAFVPSGEDPPGAGKRMNGHA
jgi:2-polyprenyl-3-methyl-5-hydroxy-6-metoxy-1,4-benzoquinol methylase